MKISIITVVYNNERTIESAIQSVLNQTYQNIEYIIIDGRSRDNTLSIINKYRDRVSIIISEEDKGIYDAMNKGIGYATGEVVGILNSDDVYFDNTVIEQVVREFNEDEKRDILYGDLVYVKQNDIQKVVRNWKSIAYYDKFFEHGHVPPHPSLFLRRNVYEKCGLFNLKFKLAADYEFMLRIFKKNIFASKYIARTLVRMRLGGATNKSVYNIVKGNKEILEAWTEQGLRSPLYMLPLKFILRLKQFISI